MYKSTMKKLDYPVIFFVWFTTQIMIKSIPLQWLAVQKYKARPENANV